VLIASGKVKAHIAAIVAVVLTNLIAIFIFSMPASMSVRATLLGIVAGFVSFFHQVLGKGSGR
jgi:lactate permease